MPIGNFSQLARFSDTCGAEIPRWMRLKFEGFRDDSASIRAFGLDVVTALCDKLLAAGAPGLHFYTLNQAALTTEIWQRLGLSGARLTDRRAAGDARFRRVHRRARAHQVRRGTRRSGTAPSRGPD